MDEIDFLTHYNIFFATKTNLHKKKYLSRLVFNTNIGMFDRYNDINEVFATIGSKTQFPVVIIPGLSVSRENEVAYAYNTEIGPYFGNDFNQILSDLEDIITQTEEF